MYKMVGILKRPEGMDFGDFKTWWLTQHAPKIQQWPGLKAYRINLCTSPDQEYDGLAEMSFETREAMEAVWSTKEGQRARASATAGASAILVLQTEEHIMM